MAGSGTVADTFTRHAAGYDAMRRKLIPRFDDFYGAGLELLAELPGPLDVLDLGAGTGLFAGIVKARFPDARIHLSDASDGMLALARERLAAVPDIGFSVGDMGETLPQGPWDAVVSALAIHHLPHEAKRGLFARIRAVMKPGGWFVNAEQVLGPDAETEVRHVRLWHHAIREAGVPEDEIAAAADRMRHDICAPVEDQLRWLREAGFSQVDAPFRHWRFAVLVARA